MHESRRDAEPQKISMMLWQLAQANLVRDQHQMIAHVEVLVRTPVRENLARRLRPHGLVREGSAHDQHCFLCHCHA
jgi:hypothetical protein